MELAPGLGSTSLRPARVWRRFHFIMRCNSNWQRCDESPGAPSQPFLFEDIPRTGGRTTLTSRSTSTPPPWASGSRRGAR